MPQTDHPSNPAPPPGAVAATPAGLLRATAGAAAAAAVILTLFWLPAEYGIDPTGVGRVLGLTRMGEIKQQLYAEAAAENAAENAVAENAVAENAAAADGDLAVRQRLDAIEAQLAAIAAALGAEGVRGAGEAVSDPSIAATPPASVSSGAAAAAWRDEVSYVLPPGEGVEVKLVMAAGAVARFQWTANGAVLNHDTHGHGSGQRVTYERGRGVAEQDTELVAAFSGQHGWFWRNRTAVPVTLTLRTGGDYSELRAP